MFTHLLDISCALVWHSLLLHCICIGGSVTTAASKSTVQLLSSFRFMKNECSHIMRCLIGFLERAQNYIAMFYAEQWHLKSKKTSLAFLSSTYFRLYLRQMHGFTKSAIPTKGVKISQALPTLGLQSTKCRNICVDNLFTYLPFLIRLLSDRTGSGSVCISWSTYINTETLLQRLRT